LAPGYYHQGTDGPGIIQPARKISEDIRLNHYCG
jgi:hypothetical protein